LIHHYHTKSREEFLIKAARGRSSVIVSKLVRNATADWLERDVNDIEDQTAWLDFNNRLKLVQNLSLPPENITSLLLEACHGNHHCDIDFIANNVSR
jgi:hypothetical protein